MPERFSLRHFYDRRIRRIFPALIVVLCAVLVLGWLWMLPAAYARLSADVFASAAFFANIALLLQSGYFDIESAKKPLLHLWSLGIEEQFYLFWPLILMLAARLRLSLLAVAAGDRARVICPQRRADRLQPGRDLLSAVHPRLGIARGRRACLRLEPVQPERHRQQLGAPASASLLIAISRAVLDSHSAFPGWWALLPVAGQRAVVVGAGGMGRPASAGEPACWCGSA